MERKERKANERNKSNMVGLLPQRLYYDVLKYLSNIFNQQGH